MEVERALLPYQVLEETEAQALAGRLQAASQAVYKSERADTVLRAHLTKEEYDHLAAYAEAGGVDANDGQAVQGLLGEAMSSLEAFSQVVLRLAFKPRYEFLLSILDWFEGHMSASVRVQVVHDKNVIGGFVMEYGGRVYDQSLRQDLEKMQLPEKLQPKI